MTATMSKVPKIQILHQFHLPKAFRLAIYLSVFPLQVYANTMIDYSLFLDMMSKDEQSIPILAYLIFFGIVMLGFEVMSYLALHTGEWLSMKRIPVRGKHLDDLEFVSTSLWEGCVIGT
jgi:hypothetical protein